MVHRVVVVLLLVLALVPVAAGAQDSRFYVGGAYAFNNQPHSTSQPLGGTTWAASFSFGVQLSSRLAVEVEPSFSGTYSWEYSYRPTPTLIADVVASRRDTFFSVLVKGRGHLLEPSVGVAFMRGEHERRATLVGGASYFNDSEGENGAALVGGLDAALPLSTHFFLVPTLRFFAVLRPESTSANPSTEETRTGPFVFRYGVGARVAF